MERKMCEFNFYKRFEMTHSKDYDFIVNPDDPKYADKDDALLPAKVVVNPTDPDYGDDKQWQRTHTFSVARTKGGRIFLAYYSAIEHAGEDVGNYNMIISSDDEANSFQNRVLITAPNPENTRVFDVNLFVDDNGRFWIFWDQTYGQIDGRVGVWAIYSDNPDDDVPVFSEPRRIANGIMASAPIIREDKTWMIATYIMDPRSLHGVVGLTGERSKFAIWNPDYLGVSVYQSKDQGENWEWIAKNIQFPYSTFDEPSMVELSDGRLWMIIRGKNCYGETYSSDGGYTWTTPRINFKYNFPDAHASLKKLKSGNLLLVANYKADMFSHYGGRNHLTALLSKDDGQTWDATLLLDEREGAEQPGIEEGDNGFIYITYGRAPQIAGESLMAIITEEDIEAGKLVNPKSRMRILAGKSTGIPNGPDYAWVCETAKKYNIEL